MVMSKETGEQLRDYHDDFDEESYLEGMAWTALAVWKDPRRREAFEQFASGDIHNHYGGGLLAANGSGRTFWHDHGTYVADNTAIYQLRADDEGVMQMYVSPTDRRGGGLFCIQPYTYDSYRNSDDTEVRVDFINGLHHHAPFNTLAETELQRRDGLDVVQPRHQDGISFDSRRDSVSVVQREDGKVYASIHDSETGLTEPLYDLADIMRLLSSFDEQLTL